MMPDLKEIFADATLGNAWKNRTPQKISRTGIDGSIPISNPIRSGMRKYSTPDSSDSSLTRINIGTSDTTTAPPCGLSTSPEIGNIRQSATPNPRDSDKLDTSIDRYLTNNLIAQPIFTDVLSKKPSNGSSWDLYALTGMHLTTHPINYVTPQFVDFGFSTVDALDKGDGLWTPSTIVLGHTDVTH